jgi:hypothetical protein
VESRLYPEERFQLWPIALLSVVFVIAAPIYWREVELPPSTDTPAAAHRDVTEFYAPVYERAYAQMRSGALPVWDPSRLCGTPVAADPRVGLFQPLNTVFLLAPFPEALAIHAFACIAMAGITFAVFARALGLGMTAALVGGLCYAFSGPAAAAMMRPPLAAALAWVPVVLWSAREHGINPRITTVVFLALTFAGLLLSGAAAVFAWTGVLAGGYAIVVSLENEPAFGKTIRAVTGWFGALCLCACIGAIQLLPSARLALQLAHPAAMVTTVVPHGDLPDSLQAAFTTLLSPGRYAKPSLVYMGVVGLAFVPAAWFSRSRFLEAVFFTVIAAGAILLVTLAPAWLPEPASLMIPAIACAAGAAALGVNRFASKHRMSKRRWVGVAAFVTLVGLIGLFIAGGSLVRGYTIVAVVPLLVLTLSRRAPIRAIAGLVLAGLVWTDLVTVARVTNAHAAGQVSATAVQPGTGRIALVGQDAPGALTRFERPRAGGYGALLTRPQAEWWSELDPDASLGTIDSAPDERLLRAMSVRTVIERGSARGDLRAAPVSRQLDATLPRAFWVPAIAWTDSIAETIDTIQTDPGMLDRKALVDSRYKGAPGLEQLAEVETPAFADTTATLQDRADDHVVVTLAAAAPGLLVLTDSYSPDWSVAIDGEPAGLLRVNGIFRGVAVPEGNHVVEFRYRPTLFYAGAVVSIVSLGLLVLWGVIRLFQ